MAFTDRIAAFFNRLRTERQIDEGPGATVGPFSGGWINSQYQILPTENQFPVRWQDAMTISSVWAAVREISESIASLPIHIYEKRPDGKDVIVPEHPLLELLEMGNAVMDGYTIRETQIMHLVLFGESYSLVQRSEGGNAQALFPIPPNTIPSYGGIRVETDPQGWPVEKTFLVQGQYRTERSVLHIVGPSWSGFNGIRPVDLFQRAFYLATQLEVYGARFFGTGRPNVLLQTQNTFTPEQASLLINSFTDAQKLRTLGVVVLPNSVTAQLLSGGGPDEAQFNQTRQISTIDIARIFRIPASRIGYEQQSTYNNLTMDNTRFYRDTIQPILDRYKRAVNRYFFPEGDYYLDFDIEQLLEGTFEEKARILIDLHDAGLYTGNEVRIELGKEPLDGLDTLKVDSTPPEPPESVEMESDETDDQSLDDAGNIGAQPIGIRREGE